jgi:hypothetical protein
VLTKIEDFCIALLRLRRIHALALPKGPVHAQGPKKLCFLINLRFSFLNSLPILYRFFQVASSPFKNLRFFFFVSPMANRRIHARLSKTFGSKTEGYQKKLRFIKKQSLSKKRRFFERLERSALLLEKP